MNISWELAQTFLEVAECRSFSAAARALGVGQPAVSRRVATLEEQLGCALFARDRRGATLTADGERLLPAAQQMARWAGELNRVVAGQEKAVEGVVRIAAPPGVAVELLAPFAADLQRRAPELRLEVLASIEHLDLARGDADLAIRTRPPTQPELVALATLTFPLAVWGAPSYVASLGSCPRVDTLAWITWSFPYAHLPPRPQLEALIPGFTPAFASDNYLVQLAALRAGLGVMILERARHPLVGDTGRVEVPVELPLPAGEMHVVCAKSMRYVPRVRYVAQCLIAELERVQGAQLRA